jgi:hypothetical protein
MRNTWYDCNPLMLPNRLYVWDSSVHQLVGVLEHALCLEFAQRDFAYSTTLVSSRTNECELEALVTYLRRNYNRLCLSGTHAKQSYGEEQQISKCT